MNKLQSYCEAKFSPKFPSYMIACENHNVWTELKFAFHCISPFLIDLDWLQLSGW